MNQVATVQRVTSTSKLCSNHVIRGLYPPVYREDFIPTFHSSIIPTHQTEPHALDYPTVPMASAPEYLPAPCGRDKRTPLSPRPGPNLNCLTYALSNWKYVVNM